MMPSEPIPTKKYGPMEAYLAEGRSIGGLSGSPVFVRNTLNIEVQGESGQTQHLHGYGAFHFLGLMHGRWDVPVGFKKNEQMEAVNLGISIVVPAKKIKEILYHPELVALRKEFDEAIAKEKQPLTANVMRHPNA